MVIPGVGHAASEVAVAGALAIATAARFGGLFVPKPSLWVLMLGACAP